VEERQLSTLEWFGKELTANGGSMIACTETDLNEQVLEVIAREKLGALQTWAEKELPDGLLDALQRAAIRVTDASDPALTGGLTGALAGVAESGTLVLTGGPGRPLSASLLPQIHLAILRANDIAERLPQALEMAAVREASSTVLINGPSRTADIEMTMTIGMHGPARLYVFCVKEG
jgi:L-lactate utilization protein LutC